MKTIRLAALLIAAVVTTACKPSGPSEAYLAVCEGPQLKTAETRNQAMEDGYEIDRGFNCITKRSVKLVAEQKAQWEAANTPEAKAARQAEFDRSAAEGRARLEAQRRADSEARAEHVRQWKAAEQVPIEAIEINSATESQLSRVQGLSADVVHQIVVERAKNNFDGWDDVVNRVVGLSAAETAVRASAFGLTVNGRSLDGAQPDSIIARYARDKWRQRSGS